MSSVSNEPHTTSRFIWKRDPAPQNPFSGHDIPLVFGPFVPRQGQRRPLDSEGRPIQLPQLKSYWNKSRPQEEVIAGQRVIYWVHTYGIRGKKCQIEVVEGPDKLLGYKTEVHKGRSKPNAFDTCKSELVERVTDLEGTAQKIQGIENEQFWSQGNLELNPGRAEAPEELLEIPYEAKEPEEQPRPTWDAWLKAPKEGLQKPGTYLNRVGKSYTKESWKLNELSKKLGKQAEQLRSFEQDPSSAKSFFDKNPHLREVILAPADQQKQWFGNQAERLLQGSWEALDAAEKQATMGRVIKTTARTYKEKVDVSGVILGNQIGVNAANHFVDWLSGEKVDASFRDIALDICKDSAFQTAQTVVEEAAIEGAKVLASDLIGEFSTEYVPLLRWASLGNHALTELSKAKNVEECALVAGTISLKVAAQVGGQTVAHFFIPIPGVGAFAGVLLSKGIEKVVVGAAEYLGNGLEDPAPWVQVPRVIPESEQVEPQVDKSTPTSEECTFTTRQTSPNPWVVT